MRDKARALIFIHLKVKHLFQTGLNSKNICWILKSEECFIAIYLNLFLCGLFNYALHYLLSSSPCFFFVDGKMYIDCGKFNIYSP